MGINFMRGEIMSLENMSAKEFMKIIEEICNTPLDDEFNEESLKQTIDAELKKSKLARDYSLIHDCYISLAEVYGYEYNNEYEALAERQIHRRRKIRKLKEKLPINKIATL